MLHPSYQDLMEVVNRGSDSEEHPLVQSRYSIIIAAAKRARQLVDGDEAMVPSYGKKPLAVAVEELYKQKIRVVGENEIQALQAAAAGEEPAEELPEEEIPDQEE